MRHGSPRRPPRHRAAIAAQKFAAATYASAILPGDAPEDWSVVGVVANVERLSIWCLAKLAETLPEGAYRVEGREPGAAIYGWLTAQYRFDRYRKRRSRRARACCSPAIRRRWRRLSASPAPPCRIRDLVNAGANDVGPAELEAEAEGDRQGARRHVERHARRRDRAGLWNDLGGRQGRRQGPRPRA
ncbi:MAG: hypothetical protein WDN24_07470 [Sphingomonas sp.]